ncbi:uncharacterized protein LOC143264682 [Megachile rotundata]|uniref:uncharacterized protein LOC143264682 n=1 Tax=Megachile rotundata TaxID=143995 RepID=UPI003FD33B89
MECIDSSWKLGEPACTDSSPGSGKNVLPIEDNFQCTFFRQSQLPDELPTPFDSSDSEFDFGEPINVTEWTDVSSINSGTVYMFDDEISHQDKKILDLPRVKFDETLCIHRNNTAKLNLKKLLSKADNIPTKVVQLTNDKTNLAVNSNLQYKNYDQKGKMLLVQCVNDNRYTHVFPDSKHIFHGTRRPYVLPNNINVTVRKRRNTFENRIVKYKRLLKSMENVIHTLSEQDSIKPRYKLAETNLVKIEPHKEQSPSESQSQNQNPSQSEKRIVDNPEIDEVEITGPVFKKPELEKFLNESMHRAVRMYRTCKNTWDRSNNEKLGMSEDLLQANIPAAWLAFSNHLTA